MHDLIDMMGALDRTSPACRDSFSEVMTWVVAIECTQTSEAKLISLSWRICMHGSIAVGAEWSPACCMPLPDTDMDASPPHLCSNPLVQVSTPAACQVQ